MLFFEAGFVSAFLPLALIGFFLVQMTGHRLATTAWLVAASLIFYAWLRLDHLAILLGSVFANFFLAGLLLRKRQSPKTGRILAASIVANLALLGVYKYLGILTFNLNALLSTGIPDPGLLLPLAISFFTFQQIAYLVDCRSGKIKPESHTLPEYLLFVTFFPQLLAGPIVRHHELMPQFRRTLSVDRRFVMLAEGLFLFACGLFKKLVIADSLAPLANAGFQAVESGTAIDMAAAWTSVLAFAFQIYFDFSAYCDMALGIALMFGIRLPWNFDSPYKSENIRDFWRQWHMTLTRWFRDYVYIPLGGNRRGTVRHWFNLFVVMLACGLWHGAHLNFLIWGALHGAFLVIYQLFKLFLRKLDLESVVTSIPNFRLMSVVVTFLATLIAWVFFRAASTDGAMTMLSSMFALADAGRTLVVTPESIVLILVVAFITFNMPNSREISERISTGFSASRFAFSARLLAGGAAGFAAAAAFIMSQNAVLSPFLYFSF